MSSLRNAVRRREHKERSQPRHRKKFGLLEKHKDYVIRAKDHNKKRDRLRKLKEKASFRNPDEFYFKMTQTQLKDGRHLVTNEDQLNHETLKMMKSQDMSYTTMKKQVDTKKAEKLKSTLHFLTERAQNTHTIFVDEEEEVKKFDLAEHFDTVPELAERAYNRPRKETLKNTPSIAPMDNKTMRQALRSGTQKYEELAERLQRMEKLQNVLQHQQTEKHLMGKGSKRKVKDPEEGRPAVYKWKRERSR